MSPFLGSYYFLCLHRFNIIVEIVWETPLFKKSWNHYFFIQIVQGGKTTHVIDAMDPSQSNWLRFVNCARNEEEQNLLGFQYHGDVYYRVYKEIEAGAELLVWYGEEYGEQLGIPILSNQLNENEEIATPQEQLDIPFVPNQLNKNEDVQQLATLVGEKLDHIPILVDQMSKNGDECGEQRDQSLEKGMENIMCFTINECK
jgi:SCY1-like protein 2